ncbi:myb-related transcription factor, partner of profilin-like isoform X2 [Heterodontus francisci]|uniref:myb-related transcription factor, partner of profilin-like isoform X2 n=1 Tax=Heterodontus francisci TaxID=7792 RepID=UPI00355B40D0
MLNRGPICALSLQGKTPMETSGSFNQLTNCLKSVELLNGVSSLGGSGNNTQTREHGSSKRQRRRAQNFTDNDLQTLLNEMHPRRDRLLGVHGRKPQKPISRAMWREVAMALNATSLTSRTADQCRKKFNDLTRAGKEKLMHNARERQECRGGIPNIKELTPYEEQAVELLGRQCGLAVVADGEIGVTVQTTEPSQQWGPEDDEDDDDDEEEEEKLCFLIDYDDDEEEDDENKPDPCYRVCYLSPDSTCCLVTTLLCGTLSKAF